MAKANPKDKPSVGMTSDEFLALVEDCIARTPSVEEIAAGVWIPLNEFRERMLAEFLHPGLAERKAREALADRRYSYRYLDGSGIVHHNDLPPEFMSEANIDFATCSAIRPARPFPVVELSAALAEPPADNGAFILMLTRFVIIGVDCAYLEAYRIEVLVPPIEAEPVKVEPPPEPASVLLPTGMPGKPNLTDIVVEEAKRRLADGEVRLKLHPFAESLWAWWEEKRKTYTQVQRPLSVKGIENAVRHLPCWRDRKTKA